MRSSPRRIVPTSGAQPAMLMQSRTQSLTQVCQAWEPVYDMNLSTVVQGCNYSGYLVGGGSYGLISFDWQNGVAMWRDRENCSEVALTQARMVKEENPKTRVFVYRNFCLALEVLRTQRTIMRDASKRQFFLQYQAGNPSGTAPGTIYDDVSYMNQSQYFWNWTNPKVLDWWLDEILGPDAVGSSFVDGMWHACTGTLRRLERPFSITVHENPYVILRRLSMV